MSETHTSSSCSSSKSARVGCLDESEGEVKDELCHFARLCCEKHVPDGW